MQRNNQPILILTCQHDSHFFEERTIVVSDVIKVGRAVARSKASPTNAIFDCKVLSRNHAVIWFTSDEFWLRDTNSSNGTFVNNTRVSKKDDSESCDRQIFSGDVIRFGVDVVENDTTHGCIIACVTLFLPNGQEAKPKLGQTGDALPSGHISINNEQLFQISSFLNEAIFREQGLDRKMESLRQALQQASVAAELGWQTMINEEKLLQKLDLYEAQMRVFLADLPEGSLKLKVAELLEEKGLLEAASKNQLVELLKDKETALQRIKDLERTLEGIQEECKHLRNEYASAQEDHTTISDEYQTNMSTITQRLNELTTEKNQLNDQLTKSHKENEDLHTRIERISRELDAAKEMYEQAQLKAKGGLVNGVDYSEDGVDAGVVRPIPIYDRDLENAACHRIDAILDDSGLLNRPEDLVELTKSEVNDFIAGTIRDFNCSLELTRLLDAKLGSHGPTTDLDAYSPVAAEANAVGVTSNIACTTTNGVSSLSNSSIAITSSAAAPVTSTSSSPPVSTTTAATIDTLVKRILQHNEAGMTSLYAYLRQFNPSAASELINAIYHINSDVDCNELDLQTFKRPTTLDLPSSQGLADKAFDAMALQGVVRGGGAGEGVTIVGADVLSTSPGVSSGNCVGTPVSPDAEEIAHLKETVRLANQEIEQYKAHIAELEITALAASEKKREESGALLLTSEQDLDEMRAECVVLRARIGDIEDQMTHAREDHSRLVEETRKHRVEVEQLRTERQRLEEALVISQEQVARLEEAQKQLSDAEAKKTANQQQRLRAVSTTTHVGRPTFEERIEIPSPRRLITMSSLTVVPLMLLVFAVMFAIFSKFVS